MIGGKFFSKTGKAASAVRSSSGVIQHGKNLKVLNYVSHNKGKSAAMGVAGLGVASYVAKGRRGPGVSKSMGRPTGMYKY